MKDFTEEEGRALARQDICVARSAEVPEKEIAENAKPWGEYMASGGCMWPGWWMERWNEAKVNHE